MFEKISIIGCGLIGSSIVRGIKSKNLTKKLSVFDKSKDVVDIIKKENLCDDVSKNVQSAIQNSDLVFICTPLSAYKEVLLSAKDYFKENAILSDTGSVKKRDLQNC